jgi:predicted HTH domain antitoxin
LFLRVRDGVEPPGCSEDVEALSSAMTVVVEIPDHLAATLNEAWDNLPQATLESLAVEGYRSGKLSAAEAGEMLGHTSRWETEEFLSAHGVWPGTTVEDLASDLATLARLREA